MEVLRELLGYAGGNRQSQGMLFTGWRLGVINKVEARPEGFNTIAR